jgi:predicted TIM-barrel fold metal-dependent hydrolase
MAGLRAHNRWLAEFCAELPGRRAGVMQIMLNDLDDAVAEIRAGREAGLSGGVLLPAIPPGAGLPPIFDSIYEPLWSVCDDLDVPVNHHSGNAIGDYLTSNEPAAAPILFLEVRQHAHRPLWHLIFAGVFDRHPGLELVLTEQGAGWMEGTLATLDFMFHRMHVDGSPERMFGYEAVSKLTRTPSQYFADHCYIGASFLTPVELPLCTRHLDRVMWGSDYPHSEGTYPYSKAALNRTFSGCAADAAAAVIGTTAASVYGLDLDALSRAAAAHGPTVDDVTGPRAEIPDGAARCVVFDPDEVARTW